MHQRSQFVDPPPPVSKGGEPTSKRSPSHVACAPRTPRHQETSSHSGPKSTDYRVVSAEPNMRMKCFLFIFLALSTATDQAMVK